MTKCFEPSAQAAFLALLPFGLQSAKFDTLGLPAFGWGAGWGWVSVPEEPHPASTVGPRPLLARGQQGPAHAPALVPR